MASSAKQFCIQLTEKRMDINILSQYRDAIAHADSEEALVQRTIEMITGTTAYDVHIELVQETESVKDLVTRILKKGCEKSVTEALSAKQPVTIMAAKDFSDAFLATIIPCPASALLIPLFTLQTVTPPAFLGIFFVFSGDNYLFKPETRAVLQELTVQFTHAVTTVRRALSVRAENQALRVERDMYHSVFENTGTGTIIIDKDMLILFANAKFAQLTGYGKEEMENNMHWSQFVIPEDNKKMQYYHYGRRKGTPQVPDEYECRIFDKTGEVKHMHMKVGMLAGTNISIASFMDITLRKVAEERLSKSEHLLKSIVSSFEGFIFTLKQNHRIEFMNNPLISRSGYNAVNEKCHKVIHGLDAPCPGCELKKVLAGTVAKREEKSPKDDRWYSVTQSPIYDRVSSITGVQVIMVDITERKHREEKVREHANYYQSENRVLRSAMKERYRFGNIIGKSNAMQKVYELILRAASSNAHVMLYGESGTGKELVATAIHKLSTRSKQMFVPVNCAAINDNLIESEFFGYKKGAFSGADQNKAGFLDLADKGTLFLDEIGDLALNLQVKLLRSIEGGGFTPVGGNLVKKPDLRIVAATNKDLKFLIHQGLMREDFFYRVNIIPIKLPPLRNRKEDIPLLIKHFISKYDKNISIPPIDKKLLDAFLNHDWPGNVRELQHSLDRYVTLKECDFLESLAPPQDNHEINDCLMDMDNGKNALPDIVAGIEKQIIAKALENNRWMKAKTASELGIHRKTLFLKMKKYDLVI